jgi:hypothetical protein
MESSFLEEYRAILYSFLEELGYRHYIDDGKEAYVLTQYVLQRFYAEDIFSAVEVDEDHVNAVASALSVYSCMTFPFISLEMKKALALGNSYLMLIDDVVDERDNKDIPLQSLMRSLVSSEPPSHPLWRAYFNFLNEDFSACYGPYASTTWVKASVEYAIGTWLERKRFAAPQGSGYSKMVREWTAQSSVQAVVCFSAKEEEQFLEEILYWQAECQDFVGSVNDLFSYYKEAIVRNEVTYGVDAQGIASGQGRLDALRQLSDQGLRAVQKWRRMVSERGIFQDRFEEFVQGYTRYHVCCDRYRLLGDVLDGDRLGEMFPRYHQRPEAKL